MQSNDDDFVVVDRDDVPQGEDGNSGLCGRPQEQERQPEQAPATPVYFGPENAYERLSRLGGGAQGNVFKCKRVSDGSVFAIKCFPIAAAAVPLKVKEVRAQMELLQNGPHVTKILDIFTQDMHEPDPARKHEDKEVCLVMEYVPNGNLGMIIANADAYFPEETILSVALQVLKAVHYLHTRNVYHMDVKPENILVAENKDDGIVVYLTDFDACRSSTAGPQNVEYTAEFTAPEVHNDNLCTAAADVFSLGVVLLCFTTLPEFPCLDNDMLWSDRWKDQAQLKQELVKLFADNRYYRRAGKRIKYTDKLIDLIACMLTYDHNCRPSIQSILTSVNNLYVDLLTGAVVPEMR
ncbi:Calcium-dependent protein kinase 1 [Diplonema papillatum]|nr:Calcium-dependent protein kinase 1 [Diplonema papillatum]